MTTVPPASVWLVCIVEDCGELAHSRYGRWCKKHLTRFLRHGDELLSLGMGRRVQHGYAKKRDPTYMSWCSMRDRCRNSRSANWLDYGGRGIRVCERWDSFANFLADMGERSAGLTLDRIDVDGNYEPGNCRWASRGQQRANQRRVTLTEEKVREIRRLLDQGLHQSAIAAQFGISRQSVGAIKHGEIWQHVA